jgi:hypothetical protein
MQTAARKAACSDQGRAQDWTDGARQRVDRDGDSCHESECGPDGGARHLRWFDPSETPRKGDSERARDEPTDQAAGKQSLVSEGGPDNRSHEAAGASGGYQQQKQPHLIFHNDFVSQRLARDHAARHDPDR